MRGPPSDTSKVCSRKSFSTSFCEGSRKQDSDSSRRYGLAPGMQTWKIRDTTRRQCIINIMIHHFSPAIPTHNRKAKSQFHKLVILATSNLAATTASTAAQEPASITSNNTNAYHRHFKSSHPPHFTKEKGHTCFHAEVCMTNLSHDTATNR